MNQPLTGRHLTVHFRDRDIVRVAYLEIVLDTGGVRGTVMQNRLNQSARLLDLGYHVTITQGQWRVVTDFNIYDFQDGMILYRSPGRNHEYARYPSTR